MGNTAILFGPFRLEPDSGRILRNGAPLALGHRALVLLEALAEAQGQLVTKTELMERVWPGQIVEEGNLTVQIAALRKALGTDTDGREYIITVPREGYKLVLASSNSGPSADDYVWSNLPKLAVLPFRNLGSETADDYFVDGVAEDITTALSRFSSFAVIAGTSVFADAGTDSRKLATELGANYLLVGSLRRAGDRLKIAAQLIETANSTQIWGETFLGVPQDVFAFQAKITDAVAAQTAPRIEAAEIDRSRKERSASLAAYDLYLRALPHLYAETRDANAEAIRLLDLALAHEPENAVYLSRASWAFEHRITMGWPDYGPDDKQRCLDMAERALALAHDDARTMAHCAMSILQVGHAYERAMSVLHRAVEINPYNALALLAAGVATLHCGPLDEAFFLLSRVVELSPRDPMLHIAYCGMAHAELVRGNFEKALDLANRSLAINTRFDASHWIMTATLSHLGRVDQARQSLANLLALTPQLSIARLGQSQPKCLEDRMAAVFAGLRAAGLPEG